LANSIATGAGLIFLILSFSEISAHFNPAVTLERVLLRGYLGLKIFIIYLLVQICGAFIGVAAANLMFELPLFLFRQRREQAFRSI
jgi:glycerol uptake facilitator-like aquaporin